MGGFGLVLGLDWSLVEEGAMNKAGMDYGTYFSVYLVFGLRNNYL